MTARPRFDSEYIRDELATIAGTLQTDATAFLVGGGAMSVRNLKDTTKDIDLIVTNETEYERLLGTLDDTGYRAVTDPGEEYRQLGARLCVKNEDGCQIDLFLEQLVGKLFFSRGMEARSEEFLTEQRLTVRLASLEDIFLFKTVATRPDDIDDMATLIQTGLNFEVIEDEIAAQAQLLGGERFTTFITESLGELDDRHGIQTPLNETIEECHVRYMNGYELRGALCEETPQTIRELATDLDADESEVEDRVEYLEQFGVVERVSGGIVKTGDRDRFQQN